MPRIVKPATGDLFIHVPASNLSFLPDPTREAGYLTGIGSREAPAEVLQLARELGAVFYSMGYTMRSGGASGMDSAFESGVLDHPGYSADGLAFLQPPMEIYLPWNGFEPIKGELKKFHNPHAGYINANTLATYAQAQAYACTIHPLGDKLRDDWHRGSFALHTRNVFQILGQDLNSLSKAVYFWALPASNGTVKGGTNTAVAIAKERGIPRMNLADPIVFKIVSQFVMRKMEQFQAMYGA